MNSARVTNKTAEDARAGSPRTPPAGARPQAVTGYPAYLDYLQDELSRVVLLVKAYAIRRSAAGSSAASAVDAVLQRPFGWDEPIAETEWRQLWQQHLRQAQTERERIVRRLSRTDAELRRTFPLERLIGEWQLRVPDAPSGESSTPELDSLLIALLDYHCAGYRAAFRTLTTEDGTAPGGLTVGMLAEIVRPVPNALEDRLIGFQPGARLVQEGLIEVGADSVEASSRRAQIDPAIAGFLLQASQLDPELQGSVQLRAEACGWDEIPAAPETLTLLQLFARRRPTLAEPLVLLLYGPAGSPFIQAARGVLSATDGRPLLIADVACGAGRTDWARWVARVYREARLREAAVLWHGADVILEAARTDPRWRDLLRPPEQVLTFLTAEAAWDLLDASRTTSGTFARIEFPVPPAEVRRRMWEERLTRQVFPVADAQRAAALDLLQSFQFTDGQIADALTIARGLAVGGGDGRAEPAGWLYDACRRVSARGLVSFTQRVPPRPALAALEAVVLAAEARQQLEELNDRILRMSEIYYGLGFGPQLGLGRGLVALFSGPSGTGKTLAATVLASCNERDLYKVDMSAVVSKYVGETEKNLARVFGDAQSANALLFFDEADAIFGKRGAVDKAQDRWANMEVNFLLQRVEEFAGVVILATNLRQNIDEAFLRRVQVLIEFKPPDAEARLKILQAMFPAGVEPPGGPDLQAFCQQFDLTGGSLKNIALDAAFRALKQRSAAGCLRIGIEHLVVAAAREYRKLSRPVTVASFGRRFLEIVKAARFHFE